MTKRLRNLAAALALAACGCSQPQPISPIAAATAPPTAQASAPAPAGPRRESAPTRDLSIDESMGGHTLTRHVDKTDAELAARLRRETQIAAASAYTDRNSAERAVGAALASGGNRLAAWKARTGRRPNLALNYVDRSGQPIGRSLVRGRKTSEPCNRALVVLRWDERAGTFYVLTSYPETEP